MTLSNLKCGDWVRIAETLEPCTLDVHKNYHTNREAGRKGQIWRLVPDTPKAFFVLHLWGPYHVEAIGVYTLAELTPLAQGEQHAFE